MTDTDELEDWSDLVSSKGWGRLETYLRKDLDEQLADKVSNLVRKGGDIEHIRQVVAVRDYVITGVLEFPRQRMRDITSAEDGRTSVVPFGHRRGKHL